MPTVRQPTLKTWLLLAVVASVLLVSMMVFRDEMHFAINDDPEAMLLMVVMLLAAIGSWLLPFVLPLGIRSSLKVGLLCGLMHVCLAALFCLPLVVGEELMDRLFDSSDGSNAAMYVYNALIGCFPISDCVLFHLSSGISMPIFVLFLLAGAVGYGVTGFFIAQSFRAKESV